MSALFDQVHSEIEYAFQKVSFFRLHMEMQGLAPSDIREPADMLRLRPTRKADYRRSFPTGVIATGYTLSSRHVMRFQSSGTDGDRLTSVILSYDLAKRQATSLTVNPLFELLWRPGLKIRTCRYAPPNCSDVECANPDTTASARKLEDGTLVLPVYHDLFTTPRAMLSKALDEIAEYDPHHLVVDPTYFAFLVRTMSREGRRCHKRAGFCVTSGYSLCTGVARRQIRDWLGPDIPFADMLGMSELGYLGLECAAGKLHLNNRDYYLEFSCNGRHADAGELAELVVTTLYDRLSPKIRYATGDVYRFDDRPCPCGSTLPVVRAEGRTRNMLCRCDDSVLTPRELDELVGDAPWIDAYRMTQAGEDDFRFQFLPNEHATTDLTADLTDRLRDALGTQHLRVEATNYFPAEPGGKCLSCISVISARRETNHAF